MTQISKILFPTDFSKASIVAFSHVLRLADLFEATIDIVHIITDDDIYDEDFIALHGNINTEFKNGIDVFEYFDEFLAEQGFDSHRVKYYVDEGDAIQQIIESAQNLNSDLVAMGSQGHSFVERVFLGSTTTELMEHSPVPVYAIPYHFRRNMTMINVGLTTELKDEDYKAMQYVISIMRDKPDVNLYSVHVDINHIAEFSDKFNNWKNSFIASNVKSFLIDDGHFLRGIDTFVETHDIDTLAMLTHKRGFIQELFNKSIAKEVSNNKNTCMLAIPAEFLKNQSIS